MKKYYFMVVLITVITLIAVHVNGVWHMPSKGRDVRVFARTDLPSADDHVFAELNQIAQSVDHHLPKGVYLEDLQPETLFALRSKNLDAINALNAWFENDGDAKLQAPAGPPRARITYQTLDIQPQALPDHTSINTLARLQLLEATQHLVDGDVTAANRAIQRALNLGHFLQQNAGIDGVWIGFWLMDDVICYLDGIFPFRAWQTETIALLPDRLSFNRAFSTAAWTRATWLHDFYADPSEGFPKIAPNAKWTFITDVIGYHAGATQDIVFADYQRFIKELSDPLDQMTVGREPITEIPSLWTFNFMGTTMSSELHLTDEWLQRSLFEGAWILGKAEVLRLKFTIYQSEMGWTENNITRVTYADNICNPFTGEPLRLNQAGLLQIMAEHDPRRKFIFHPSRHLAGMQSLAPLPNPGEPALPPTEAQTNQAFADSLPFAAPPAPVAPGQQIRYSIFRHAPSQPVNAFLEKGPSDANLDGEAVLHWQVPEHAAGVIPIEIALMNRDGALATHRIYLRISQGE